MSCYRNSISRCAPELAHNKSASAGSKKIAAPSPAKIHSNKAIIPLDKDESELCGKCGNQIFFAENCGIWDFMETTLLHQERTETVGASIDRMEAMRFKVLAADDSPNDQLLTQLRLKRSRCLDLVATVSSGQEVKEYLKGEGAFAHRHAYPFPDLLLMDVDMPGINGLEVVEWIKTQNYPRLRIVMLSGNERPETAARALALGADYFQSKNSHPSDLNHMVRRLELLMVLLENREPRIPQRPPNIMKNKILAVVDGRAPPWKQAITDAAATGKNFLLILDSESELQKLWSTLGTTNVVPGRLQRWGLLALVEALSTEDFESLQKISEEKFIYLIEQITLNRNVPPRTKRFLLYCELRGIISAHDTVEEAGLSLLSYLEGFKLARLLPLAGIYDHASGKWERVKKLSSN